MHLLFSGRYLRRRAYGSGIVKQMSEEKIVSLRKDVAAEALRARRRAVLVGGALRDARPLGQARHEVDCISEHKIRN